MRIKQASNIMSAVVVIIVSLVVTAYAQSWLYLVNLENKVVAKLDYSPDQKELTARNLIAVRSETDVALHEAEYRGGRIVKRVVTTEEKNEELAALARQEEEELIARRSLFNAYTELVNEGVTFNYVKSGDF